MQEEELLKELLIISLKCSQNSLQIYISARCFGKFLEKDHFHWTWSRNLERRFIFVKQKNFSNLLPKEIVVKV